MRLRPLKKFAIYLLVGVVFFPFIYVAYSWMLVPPSTRLVPLNYRPSAVNLGLYALTLGFVMGIIAGALGHYLTEEEKEQ